MTLELVTGVKDHIIKAVHDKILNLRFYESAFSRLFVLRKEQRAHSPHLRNANH